MHVDFLFQIFNSTNNYLGNVHFKWVQIYN